jgi:2-dehydropantoate 2-reductase
MSAPAAPAAGRHLVVGAGAVGQVYALALSRAGARVGLLARPRQVDALRAGVELRRAGRRRVDRLIPDAVLSDPAELRPGEWDTVWLCVSSPALRQGDWLGRLAQALGPGPAWVMLQPGMHDRALLLEHMPEDRLLTGLIAFSSWEGPLPGEAGPPGLRWWLPPGGACSLAGPGAPALAARLRDGGLRARAMSAGAVAEQTALGSAALGALVLAMEAGGWTFSGLRARAGDAAAAAREGMAVGAAVAGRPTPPGLSALGPWAVVFFTYLTKVAIPFPFEAFLALHFTKVGDQTREGLANLIREGRARGLPTGALEALGAAVDAARAGPRPGP